MYYFKGDDDEYISGFDESFQKTIYDMMIICKRKYAAIYFN